MRGKGIPTEGKASVGTIAGDSAWHGLSNGVAGPRRITRCRSNCFAVFRHLMTTPSGG